MLVLKTASVLNILVFWSFVVVYLAASLSLPKTYGALAQSGHRKLTGIPINVGLEAAPRTPANQRVSISKRVNDFGPNAFGLELYAFEPEDLLLPIEAAAKVLSAFYSSVALNALGAWASNSQRVWIKMTAGTLVLLMTSAEGNTVPWEFVAWFALQMLRYTERGYTGLYTAHFSNPSKGIGIWVSLYRCAIGPLTDTTGNGALAKVASCLNPNAQSWFPQAKPTR